LIKFPIPKFNIKTSKIYFVLPTVSVTSNSKTDRHDITEIFLKMALNTIILTHILKCEVFSNVSNVMKTTLNYRWAKVYLFNTNYSQILT
jgi:hypothetical protein